MRIALRSSGCCCRVAAGAEVGTIQAVQFVNHNASAAEKTQYGNNNDQAGERVRKPRVNASREINEAGCVVMNTRDEMVSKSSNQP